jgi:hypothetical protein
MPAEADSLLVLLTRLHRQQENNTRILIKIYEEAAAVGQQVERDADLRTGGERMNALANNHEVRSYWGELLAGIAVGLVAWGVQTFTPPQFGEAVREWLVRVHSPAFELSPSVVRDKAMLVIVLLMGGLFWLAFFLSRCRKRQRYERVRKALQKVHELYLSHSGLKAWLQRSRHLRVQVEAQLHSFEGRTWQQVAASGQANQMRQYLDELAEIDARRAHDEAEFEQHGGDYYLELLRAGLRGEMPLVVCGYVAAWVSSYEPGRREWQREASRLCYAERKVFGTTDRKASAFKDLGLTIRQVRSFTHEDLNAMLAAWRKYFPIPMLREAHQLARFQRHLVSRTPEQ